MGLAERAFAAELARLVDHLAERLAGTDGRGAPLVFRDTAVRNLEGFFARFGELGVRSDPELDALVERARSVLAGAAPADLRRDAPLRQRVAAGLERVRLALDAHLAERPRRRVLRPPGPGPEAASPTPAGAGAGAA